MKDGIFNCKNGNVNSIDRKCFCLFRHHFSWICISGIYFYVNIELIGLTLCNISALHVQKCILISLNLCKKLIIANTKHGKHRKLDQTHIFHWERKRRSEVYLRGSQAQ